jgi:hypothetical protein
LTLNRDLHVLFARAPVFGIDRLHALREVPVMTFHVFRAVATVAVERIFDRAQHVRAGALGVSEVRVDVVDVHV